MPSEITDVQIIHEGWGRFLVATIRLPDGQLIRREIEDHGNAVAVLPYDPVRRTAILVRQFRAPLFFATGQEETLEVVAGGVEGSDPAECARREALEEAGLKLHGIEHVLSALNMPGVSTMRLDMYLATYQKEDRVQAGGGLAEEDEYVTTIEMPLAELARLIDGGGLVDLATAALVQTLRLRQPGLFSD